jgi:hypothetical protein
MIPAAHRPFRRIVVRCRTTRSQIGRHDFLNSFITCRSCRTTSSDGGDPSAKPSQQTCGPNHEKCSISRVGCKVIQSRLFSSARLASLSDAESRAASWCDGHPMLLHCPLMRNYKVDSLPPLSNSLITNLSQTQRPPTRLTSDEKDQSQASQHESVYSHQRCSEHQSPSRQPTPHRWRFRLALGRVRHLHLLVPRSRRPDILRQARRKDLPLPVHNLLVHWRYCVLCYGF